MKQLVQSMRTGAVGVLDVPAPQLRGPGVLVHTACTLISPGTERAATEFARASLFDKARSRPDLVKQVIGKLRRDGLSATVSGVFDRLDRPAAPGYAAAGTVLAVAAGVTGVAVGDRVACAGATYATHAEVNYVPRNLMALIPTRSSGEPIGFDEAAFTTLGAIALHGSRLAQPQLGDSAVVIGLGVIGLLAVQLLRAHGCRVMGVDHDLARCELARVLGADRVANPHDAAAVAAPWTRGLGADLVLVTAATQGSDPAVLAAELARDKGRLVTVGATGLDLPRRVLFQKELSVVVSRSYGPGRYDPDYEERGQAYPLAHVRWTEQENMRAFLDLLASDRLDVRPLVSHRFPIAQGEQAYAVIEQGPTLGVLLEYPPAAPSLVSPTAWPQDGSVGWSVTQEVSTPSNRPRVSVIGAGNFARTVLLPLLARGGRAELRTIVAATGISAHDAAGKFGFAHSSTSDGEIWADGASDAVVIATRHDSHANLVVAALRAGQAAFVEKPLCIRDEDVDRIEDAYGAAVAAGRQPFVMVGFNRRFAPAIQTIRSLAPEGSPLSIVYRINAGRLPASSWLRHHDEGGGRIVGEVCHFVDLCAYLANAPIVEVSAMRSAVADEDVVIALRMLNGSIATVAYLTDGSSRVPKERVEIFGGGHTAVIDDFRRLTVNGAGVGRWRVGRPRQDKGHDAEMAAFLDAVARGAASPVPFASAVNATRATFAILQSLETNGPVRLT